MPIMGIGVEGDFEKSGKRAGGRFGSTMAKAAGGAMAVLGSGALLKGAISEASDLNESLNAISVTYGENAGDIEKLGKRAANALGLSNVEFNNIAVHPTVAPKDVQKRITEALHRHADIDARHCVLRCGP